MDKTLFLSHLPLRIAFHPATIRLCRSSYESGHEPEAGAIADAICREERAHARAVWETIHASRRAAELSLEQLRPRNLSVVTFWSPDYPRQLRTLEEPPWSLFYSGTLPSNSTMLAVVGSRRPDRYGMRLVADFLTRVKAPDYQVVSGLARGIDSLAHFFSCEMERPNFAVLGSGADILYPPENIELAERIIDVGGGILSELPPGTPPRAMHFPRRNRIISGLASVVWVVQGTGKSGSYHTARAAMDQDRTVVAVPGDVHNPLSQIPNRLLYDGAQVMLQPDDLDWHVKNPGKTRRDPPGQQLPLIGDGGLVEHPV